MIGGVEAQIDDRGYPISPPASGVGEFSFEKESYLAADVDIPAVNKRDEGPSIEVTEFQFQHIPEFPELGITRRSVTTLAEDLRQQYTQKPHQLNSGYTEQELQAIADILPRPETEDIQLVYSIDELEQVADYIVSISDGETIGGLRQYEVKGLVNLLTAQQQAQGQYEVEYLKQLNSIRLDELIRLVKRQRAERGINFYELEDIANKISAFYRSKGIFLARAYIPEQQVEGGIVTFNILEGVLGEVTVANNKKYSTKRISAPFKQLIGQAAKSDEIEEGLYLVNDFPGLVVRGALSGGSKIGETSMNLNVVEEKPWRVSVTADNHGSVFTGDNRVLTMVDFFNPLGYGDILTVGYLKSWSPLNSDVAIFQYRAPVWDGRTHAYVSADVNEFMVDGNGDSNIDDLNIEGKNTNYTVGIDRQFKRLPAFSLSAGFALTEKETEIDAVIPIPNTGSKVQGVELNLSLNNLSKRFELMNMMMASVQYGEFKSGVNEFVGQDEVFYKFALDWSALKLVNLPFSRYQSYILAKSKWRYSESELPAFEQLPLGGADAVRAFTVSEFSADQAVYLGVEWYVDVPIIWFSDSFDDKLKVALFADGAYGVSNIDVNGVNDSWANLAGAGVLFKLSWRDRLSTQISFSKPVGSKSSLDGLGDDADSIQTYVEFSFAYD